MKIPGRRIPCTLFVIDLSSVVLTFCANVAEPVNVLNKNLRKFVPVIILYRKVPYEFKLGLYPAKEGPT
jgi:hypothetical protein